MSGSWNVREQTENEDDVADRRNGDGCVLGRRSEEDATTVLERASSSEDLIQESCSCRVVLVRATYPDERTGCVHWELVLWASHHRDKIVCRDKLHIRLSFPCTFPIQSYRDIINTDSQLF
ncbi:hypothetical protein MLD38_026986 [Melastoma candidum]|uniref:Uncharacterized protein n=1 Tax=Melastoma candidum TaxID=119954 RepID=A0ACB9P1N1_9MYRT|nr:hypothetical protein MLD38_026986 [Melastoma candidum]